jgi:galactokinase
MANIESLTSKLEIQSVQALEALYGTSASENEKQRARYIAALKKFQSAFQDTEVEAFSSPGRTEIGGNHTDHNHGRVLAGAVNLDNIAIVAKNNLEIIRIVSVGYPEFEVGLDTLVPIPEENFTSAAIIRGICSRMKENGYAIGGFNALIDGAVPKGSGLSSSASFEVLIGTILNSVYNNDSIDPIDIAKIGQYAENVFFGKPCGLMDQTACACGGLVAIDFENPAGPKVKRVSFDFRSVGFNLVITDTGGSHADLNEEYASLPVEMKSVAHEFGKDVLRQVEYGSFIGSLAEMRDKVGDRALLRAYHFFTENQRVLEQVDALEKNNLEAFLELINASGRSSFMYNQNIYPTQNTREQGISLALALSESVLKDKGAWRVHGGGFAGTIQAFVPDNLLQDYMNCMDGIFGPGSCHNLFIRPIGATRIEL